MPAISVVATDVILLKEFMVINLSDSSTISGVVVFTPRSSGETTSAAAAAGDPPGVLIFSE